MIVDGKDDGKNLPKRAPELKALQVKRLNKPGRHNVGGATGLYLNITETGARSWILCATVGGKRRYIGLGPYPEVSLSSAREAAQEMHRRIRAGGDPVAERRLERQENARAHSRGVTFNDAFKSFYEEKVCGELSNAKHINQWRSTIDRYASPVIGGSPVKDLSVEDILAVLKPIWTEKNETASRLRGRMEAVLDWAKVMGLRDGENPARWKGNLQQLLPSPNKVQKTVSQPALALDQASAWFLALRRRNGMAARALEFLTLTAARSGEVRGALWLEIDLKKGIWIVPADRMKARREHRVTLSAAAVELLEDLPRFKDCPIVFPSRQNGQLSDMTISAVMRRIQEDEVKAGRPGYLDRRSSRPAVPHGLRSTFRDWAAERTSYPREVAEMALAHDVGSAVERAYRRSDFIEQRRRLMEDWSEFLRTET